MGFFARIFAAGVAEAADQIAAAEAARPPDPMRWAWRVGVVSVLVIGWMFILWQNRFHVTLPVVIVCLAYLAVVATVFNLWRTSAVAVAINEDDERDSTWGSTLGERGELEREKKSLLRAIKEAEFDREMGKLSKIDSDEMIAVYRARAIEVIKELDRLDAGSVGTVREQIQREVKARLEIEQKTKAVAVAEVAKIEAKKKPKKGATAPAKAAEATEAAAAKAATALEKTSAAVKAAKKAVEVSADASVPAEEAAAAKAEADAALAEAEAAMADANSAAAVVEAAADAANEEPKADAKEATP
jgi:hypothetical protein